MILRWRIAKLPEDAGKAVSPLAADSKSRFLVLQYRSVEDVTTIKSRYIEHEWQDVPIEEE